MVAMLRTSHLMVESQSGRKVEKHRHLAPRR
jgi:hypothetical protein